MSQQSITWSATTQAKRLLAQRERGTNTWAYSVLFAWMGPGHWQIFLLVVQGYTTPHFWQIFNTLLITPSTATPEMFLASLKVTISLAFLCVKIHVGARRRGLYLSGLGEERKSRARKATSLCRFWDDRNLICKCNLNSFSSFLAVQSGCFDSEVCYLCKQGWISFDRTQILIGIQSRFVESISWKSFFLYICVNKQTVR